MYVRKARLRWAGHVSRMDDGRLPKKVLFGDIVGNGEVRRGNPGKKWYSCFQEDLELVDIKIGQWTVKAKDRNSWLNSISYLTPAKEK